MAKLILCCLALTFTGVSLAAPSRSGVIDLSLLKTLKTKGRANIIISFEGGNTLPLQNVKSKSFNSRSEKINAVYHELKTAVDRSQKSVLQYLRRDRANPALESKSFWISNQLYIQHANLQLVQDLAEKFYEIVDIVEEEIIQLDDLHLNQKINSSDAESWGIIRVKAKQAWRMENGNSGENIVVANIDTGVSATHEALRGNFIGPAYGWYDPYDQTETPNDIHGHGTHTMGLIAGSHGIGVAPGSKWMACRGCYSSLCLVTGLLACGEFLLCPTLQDATDPDCSKAPSIISNSWGGGRNNQMYHPVINAWVAAGIIPVFSNGNNGPSCDSANSPADHMHVIGVGSINNFDQLSEFSSKGPTVNNTLKPDIVGPGQSVLSASSKGDNQYVEMTGTSMAAPMVAGTVAILLSENPDLNLNQIKEYLFIGADKTRLPSTGYRCGDIDETEFPNHSFGNGILNVESSLSNLVHERKLT